MRYEFSNPPPYPHQVRAFQRMIKTKGVTALLMEPGTGKTRAVIDYVSLLARANGLVRVMVLAPVAALDTWTEQAVQYAPHHVSVRGEILEGPVLERAERIKELVHDTPLRLRATQGTEPGRLVELLVTNLEAFSQRRLVPGLKTVRVLDRLLDAVRAWQPEVLVVDESHRIKGISSNTSTAIARLRDDVPRRLILTGTVMPHSPLDVYAQWRFLNPHAFSDDGGKPWTASEWKDRYAETGGYMGREIVGWKHLDDMEDRMARNSIVVRKKDALDLPPTTDVTVSVHLSPKERKAYRSMKDELAVLLDKGEIVMEPGHDTQSVAANRLVQILRLRQITSGFLPTDEGTVEQVGQSKVKTAVSLASDLLASEDRLVVFAHFVDEVETIADALRKRMSPIAVDSITGATKPKRRTELRKAFGDLEGHPEKRVLVCQMRTMSLAVNELVTASHAIYASLSERRDDYVQSRDRLDRIGQTLPVTFHHLIVPQTIDEVILRSHRDRTSLEQELLAYVRERNRA